MSKQFSKNDWVRCDVYFITMFCNIGQGMITSGLTVEVLQSLWLTL